MRKIKFIECIKGDDEKGEEFEYEMNIFLCECGAHIGKDQAVLEGEVECDEEKPIVCPCCGNKEDTDIIFTMTPEEMAERDKREAETDD